MEFKDNGEFIEVWEWEPIKGDDYYLFGAIRKDADGYHWFHPVRVMMSSIIMHDISKKLSELNLKNSGARNE